jgi:hypothetical protein
MNYTGYLREEEEYPVTGTEWGEAPCLGLPCPGDDEPVVLDLPEGDHRRNNSRRIDMAAVINEHAAPFYEFECTSNDKDLDLEATDGDRTLQTRGEWSANYSDDLKSEESQERAVIWGPFVCSPCTCRFLFIAFTLFALFITGLGVGVAVRDGPSEQNSFSANIGFEDSTAEAGLGGPMDSSGSSQGGSSLEPPTLAPTEFEFDFDYGEIDLGEEENYSGGQQPGTNNSPYLVGAYYYPW